MSSTVHKSANGVEDEPVWWWWKRMRYVITMLIWLCIMSEMCMRTAHSIGIVAMTNNSTESNIPTFQWDQATQGTILSALFWGYVATNVPAALLMARFGSRWIMLTCMLGCSVANFLIPVLSEAGGWQALCALRVIQGLTQGALLPGINTLLAMWAPPEERAQLAAIVYSGTMTANVLSLALSGALVETSSGWPSIFYTYGCLGVVWCALWWWLGYDSPAEHPYISSQERHFIQSFHSPNQSVKSFHAPWLAIFTSVPV